MWNFLLIPFEPPSPVFFFLNACRDLVPNISKQRGWVIHRTFKLRWVVHSSTVLARLISFIVFMSHVGSQLVLMNAPYEFVVGKVHKQPLFALPLKLQLGFINYLKLSQLHKKGSFASLIFFLLLFFYVFFFFNIS